MTVGDEQRAVGKAPDQDSPDFAGDTAVEFMLPRSSDDRCLDGDDQRVAEPRTLLLVPSPRHGEISPGLGPEDDGLGHCCRLNSAFTCSQGIAACSPLSWRVEVLGQEETLFVGTANCDYIDLRQLTTTHVEVGDELHVRLWHDELTAFEEAEAHVALALGGATVSQETVPIPFESGLLSATWASSVAATEASEVVFHLPNHGSNSWNLIEFTARSASGAFSNNNY